MSHIILVCSESRPEFRNVKHIFKSLRLSCIELSAEKLTEQMLEHSVLVLVDEASLDKLTWRDSFCGLKIDPLDNFGDYPYVKVDKDSFLRLIKQKNFGKVDPISDLGLFMEKVTGVTKKKDGKHIIETRVKNRLDALKIHRVSEYISYLFNHWDTEINFLISQSTTHTTSFFREKDHIWQVAEDAIKYWQRSGKEYRIWCAGSSTGQEVYSIAYAIWKKQQEARRQALSKPVKIIGSDICEKSIYQAKQGVYRKQAAMKDVGYAMGREIFDIGMGSNQEFVRIKDNIFELSDFQSHNLCEGSTIGARFHSIFCRNVFIYFTDDVVRKILEEFHSSLEKDGRLYIGKTDYISNYQDLFIYEGNSVYKKIEASSHKAIDPSVVRLPTQHPKKKAKEDSDLIVIGGSTGGTRALLDIVSKLKCSMPPIVVAQHLQKDFFHQFLRSLQGMSHLNIKILEHGELLCRDTLYLAPGGFQTKLRKRGRQLIAEVFDTDPSQYQFAPCVDVLFDSVAKFSESFNTRAVLLTGMGKDGAQGLLKIRKQGGRTMAQDEASSAVFGMPKVAIQLGAAEEVVPLHLIPHKISS